MSTNLGTVLVGLGYDLSALEKGAPEAFRLINSQTLGMSAEMKRASREGAESFRLIDEALGIHLSRPLTRLLTQEFPSLAKGLQSILGVGVVGALGVAGVELFDKIAKGIEHAQKAEEAFQDSMRKTATVFSDASQSFAKEEKARSLAGLDKALFEIDYSSVEEGRKKIEQLAEAMDKEAKASAEANKWTTKLLAGIGDFAHVAFSTRSTLGQEDIGKRFEEFRRQFDELSKLDALKGTHEGANLIASELEKAQTALTAMSALKLTGVDQFKGFARSLLGGGVTIGFTQAEIDAQQKFIDNLKKISDLLGLARKDQTGKDSDARAADALKAQQEVIRELQGDLKGWNDEADKGWKTWIKINEEIEKAAGVDFSGKTSTGAGTLGIGGRRLPSLGQIGPPPGAPQLSDLAELDKVTSDQNESWKKAGEIVASLETPLQKFSAQLAIVKELENQGRISTAQFAQAQQLLQEQLEQTEQRMEKLLKSGGAAGGLQAFLIQMQGEASKGSSGQFTFDILNKGLQGFEDETVKALTGAKTSWTQYFASLDQMALKFLLNKELASLFKGFAGGSTIGGQGAAAATQLSAGTLMQTAATTQLAAAQLMAAGSGGGAGGIASLMDVFPAFAGGTDFAPGGLSLVGENGPELVNLPSGASVTPNSMLRGGHTFVANIDAKGAEIGVEAKIARALEEAGPRFIMQAVVESSEAQRRTAR